MLATISGAASFFSFSYRPGATNAQAWYRTYGSAIMKAASAVTFTGTMNGVMTPVAIIFAFGPITSISGRARRS